MVIRNQRPNPYVGPRAFETGEKLFGRDKEINELINILIAERIVLLYSPSGAGKTSLIRAGLIPLLERDGFPTLPIVRVNIEPPDDGAGLNFNRYIYSTLISLQSGLPEQQQTPIETLAKMSLSEYLDQRPRPEAPSDDDFWERSEVLIFDQFEEVITASPLDLESKAEFFTQLGEALLDKKRWALFAMREDFIGALDPYLREIQNHLDVRFRLNLLGIDVARQSIQQPPRQVGVEFKDSAAGQLVSDLSKVQQQLPDGSMVEKPGPYIEPVQLQVVCYRLWRHLASDDMLIDEEDLEAVGDVDQSLAEYYNDSINTIVEKSGESEHSIRFWFDHYLITEGKIRSQVLMEKDSSLGLPNPVIFDLENSHLIRRDIRQGKTWFELAHDRLINPVRESNAAWFKAHQSPFQRQAALWQEQNYPDSLLLTGKELAKVESWVSEQKRQLSPLEKRFLDSCRRADDQKTKRRLRRSRLLIAILTLLTLFSCVVGSFAVVQRQIAVEQKAYADEQRQIAEEQKQYADEQRQIAVEQRRAAEEQRQIAEEQKQYADEQRQIAVEQRRAAEEQRQLAEFQRQIRSLEAQALSNTETQPDLALLLSLEAYRLENSSGSKGVLLDVIVKNKHLGKYVRHHTGSVAAVAFRPDGHILATGSEDGTVVLWDRLANLPLGPSLLQDNVNRVFSLAFNPNGGILAAGTEDGSIYLWDVTEPLSPAVQLAEFSEHTKGVFNLAFRPDGKFMASASDDGRALLWDLENLELFMEIDIPGVRLAFSPDGLHLALGDSEGYVTVLDARTFEQTSRYQGHSGNILSLEFSPDSKTLASGSSDKNIVLWDMDSNQWIDTLRQHSSYVFELAFSSDGQKLASGGRDHTILVWDLSSRQIPERLHGHTGPVVSLAFDPLDNYRLLSGSWDHSFIEWYLNIDQPLVTDLDLSVLPTTTHSNWISSVVYNPDGQTLASADADGKVFLWSLEELLPYGNPLELDSRANVLGYSPDGQILAIGSCSSFDELAFCSAGQLALRDAHSLELIGEALSVHENWITALAFSYSDSLLVTGSSDNTVILWDISNPSAPEKLSTIRENTGSVLAVSISRDGKLLASGSEYGKINLWEISDPESPTYTASLDAAIYEVFNLAFSPDGKILASGNGEGVVSLWDLNTLQQIGSNLLGHKGPVRSVAYSPDGLTLASGGDDGAVVLWDVTSHTRIGQPLPGHSDAVYSLAFSPDGKKLSSGGSNGELLLWHLADGDLAQIACNKIARNLTSEEIEKYHSGAQPEITCPGVVGYAKLLEADAYALSGEHERAATAFEEAVLLATPLEDFSLNNSICWFGSLDGLAEIVMPACERAVELGTLRSIVLDSRGLARALSEDYTGAIDDFSQFIHTYEDFSGYADLVDKRRGWIADLRAGRNPFDAETLKSLRLE
jgi:WD40 repeat protein